jgi:hypothetical protein
VDKQARKAFSNGIKLFKKGNFEEAATKFEKAYELKPSWKLLYNIGQCAAALNEHGAALDAFEGYLSQGGDEVTQERREEVLAEIKRLREMVGLLEFAAPPGAEVSIDGEVRGQAPLSGRIRVAVGVDHEILVTLDGEELLARTVRVGGGETLVIDARPEPEAPAEPSAQPTADDSGPRDPKKIWGWVAIGVGGALVITGAITGGVALAKNGEIEDNCPQGNCPPPYHDDVEQRDRLALTADILLPVGAAAAVAGVLLLTLPWGESAGETATARVQPLLGADRAGLAAQWRF